LYYIIYVVVVVAAAAAAVFEFVECYLLFTIII
jgi:hypothetical protein